MAKFGRAAALSLLTILLLATPTWGQDAGKATPPRIEAAFLRNFARYVTWPPQAFADDRSPWRICILGNDPFGDVLDETLRGRTEQGRPFVVVRTESPAETRPCHVVFMAVHGGDSRRAALAELANRPVLTVSDAPAFLQEGGMIRFQVSDHVEFAVNLDRTNSASLRIPTKMLEVAQEVLENGIARRRP
jgi:hypothetical protein